MPFIDSVCQNPIPKISYHRHYIVDNQLIFSYIWYMSNSHKKDLVTVIRKLQTIISVVLFFVITIFCLNVTDFKLGDIQLSEWGGSNLPTTHVWNGLVSILSISILFNTLIFIKKHVRLQYKTIPYVLFSILSLCLLTLAIFNLEHKPIHNIAAYIYFFLYPLSIFVMAYLNRKTLRYKEWFTHLMFSIIMMVLPLTCTTIFKGMAVAEIAHIVIVSTWNLYVAFKKFLI